MKNDLALPLDLFVGNANGKGLIRIETSIDARPSGVHIASLTRDKKEYAELIVHAVNNFDALLEACKVAVDHLRLVNEPMRDGDALNKLVNAIANAEK